MAVHLAVAGDVFGSVLFFLSCFLQDGLDEILGAWEGGGGGEGAKLSQCPRSFLPTPGTAKFLL